MVRMVNLCYVVFTTITFFNLEGGLVKKKITLAEASFGKGRLEAGRSPSTVFLLSNAEA